MSKIKSLQYLLLDTLSKRVNKISNNLAQTLNVKEDKSYYIISWIEKSEFKQFKIEKNKFIFYQRNDIENNPLDLSQSLTLNNKNANLIIDNIVKESKKIDKTISFFKKDLSQVFIIITSLIVAVYFSDLDNKIIPVTLGVILLLELIEEKKIFFYFLILAMSLYKPNYFIIFYGIFLIIFNFVEPIYFFKKTKIFLIGTSVVLNCYFLDLSLLNFDSHFIILFLLSVIMTLINFTKYNSNYNWIYCLPSFAFGFFFNNEILISYLWIFYCILIPVIFNFLDKKIFFK